MPVARITTFVEYPPGSGIVISNFDGIMAGKLGVIAGDYDRIQCHCCGRAYVSVAAHANMYHHITADEYREAFQLSYTQGLVSEEYSARMKAEATKRDIMVLRDALTSVGRGRTMKGRTQRLQSVYGNRRSHPPTYVDVECSVCGSTFRTSLTERRTTCSDVCRARRRVEVGQSNGSGPNVVAGRDAFWASPNGAARREVLREQARANTLPRILQTCVVCGAQFPIPRYRRKQFTTCSPECRTINKSRVGHSLVFTPERNRRVAAAKTAFWASARGQALKAQRTAARLLCSIDVCEAISVARGLCSMHYQRLKAAR